MLLCQLLRLRQLLHVKDYKLVVHKQ